MFKQLLQKFRRPETVTDQLVIDSDAPIGTNGVLTETFGIRIYDGTIAPFTRAGEPYPITGSYSFSTDEDLQDQITLEFHRGSGPMASAESFIAKVRIKGYMVEEAREPRVRVHYELSDNKISIWAENEKKNGKLTLSLTRNAEGENVH